MAPQRWFQFRLRTLLVFMLAAGPLTASLVHWELQRRAHAELERSRQEERRKLRELGLIVRSYVSAIRYDALQRELQELEDEKDKPRGGLTGPLEGDMPLGPDEETARLQRELRELKELKTSLRNSN